MGGEGIWAIPGRSGLGPDVNPRPENQISGFLAFWLAKLDFENFHPPIGRGAVVLNPVPKTVR